MLQGMADAVLPRKFFESESVLLKTLKRDNETLANINSHFLDIYQRFRIHMVHENHKTDVKGTKLVLYFTLTMTTAVLTARRIIVVDSNSASPQLPGVTYYGVEATHTQLCRFASADAPGYRALSTDARQWVRDAPLVIQVRWAAEEQEQAIRMRVDLQERMSPFVSADYLGFRNVPLADFSQADQTQALMPDPVRAQPDPTATAAQRQTLSISHPPSESTGIYTRIRVAYSYQGL
jgi:hypothetical protein